MSLDPNSSPASRPTAAWRPLGTFDSEQAIGQDEPGGMREAAWVALVLLLHLVLFVSLAREVAWTTDEPLYVRTGRLLVEDEERWGTEAERAHGPLAFLAAQLFVGEFDPNELESVRVPARLGMGLYALLLLGVIWAWSRAAWGPRGALISLLFATLDPTLAGFAPLVITDVALAASALFAFWSLWRWLRQPSPLNLTIWGVATGLMLATKFTALILVCAMPLIVLSDALVFRNTPQLSGIPRARWRALWSAVIGLGLAGVVALFVLHATYLFSKPLAYTAYETLRSEPLRALAGTAPGPFLLGLLPGPFVLGVDFQLSYVPNAKMPFLGSSEPSRLYYPLAFLVKTPIPELILFGLAFGCLWRSRGRSRLFLCLSVPGLVLLGYLTFLSERKQFRYLFSALPPLFVALGCLGQPAWTRRPWSRGLTGALALWMMLCTARAWPDFLGYFNAFVGGPGGAYRVFADDAIDWNQHPQGPALLEERYPDLRELRAAEAPAFGTLVVRARRIGGGKGSLGEGGRHWLQAFEPIDHLGSAWLVFRVQPESFRMRSEGGDGQAAMEETLAWIDAGDLDAAEAALGRSVESKAAGAMGELIRALRAWESHPADRVDEIHIAKTLVRLGLFRRAEPFLERIEGQQPVLAALLLARIGRESRALDLLRDQQAQAGLKPAETLFFASLLMGQGLYLEALEWLDRVPPPLSAGARVQDLRREAEILGFSAEKLLR